MQSPTLAPDKRSPALLAKLDQDYSIAAWTATLRQNVSEEAAQEYGISVTDYLRAMDMHCCNEFKQRPTLMDPIEADHLQAMLTANTREKQRERDTMRRVRELNQAAYYRSNKLQCV